MSREDEGVEEFSLPFPGFRLRGLSTKLLLGVVLPITLLLLGVTLGSVTLHQRAMRSLVGERDQRVARMAASAINEQLNHRALAVRGISSRAADPEALQDTLRASSFLEPDFGGGLAFYSSQGELLAASKDFSLYQQLDPQSSQQLKEFVAQAGAEPGFSPLLSVSTGEKSFMVAAAAVEPGGPITVGAFRPSALIRNTISRALVPGEEARTVVVSGRGELLYRTGDFVPAENIASHPGVEDALRGESGVTYLNVEGSEHVIAFSPVNITGWAVVIEEPWEAVTNPVLNTTLLAPLILIPVLLLALVALWFGTRQIIQPLQALEGRASDLAWGNYQSIQEPVGGIEEIESLQKTLAHMANKVQEAHRGLRSYIDAITKGQEEERRRLARELHDETIQALIALNQQVQITESKIVEGESSQQLQKIQEMTLETIQSLRRLIRGLRPEYLEDLGLVAALEMLTKEMDQNADPDIEFVQRGQERRLPSEVELVLYRIVQEGLRNVIQHAGANQARVHLAFTPQKTELKIEDDGKGFDAPEHPTEFAPRGHFGLLGIQERAEMIGAQLVIHSAPGGGTRLVVILEGINRN
ncbi:MAG: cache domain-containing protein [Anaerolineales bacterium]